MRIAAVICEYNPFHNGHKFHIEETRKMTKADAVVAVMSGNFVQRGDVAVFDKKTRATAAVAGGADIVLELPSICSMQSAEFFARNAVYILSSLETVTHLSFGAETDDVQSLFQVGRLLADEPEDFKAALARHMSGGASFPSARMAAVSEILGSEYASLLKYPNNILGIEYIKALSFSDSPIVPVAVQRCGTAHDSDTGNGTIASASYIRSLLLSGDIAGAERYIPPECAEIYRNAKLHSVKGMERAIIADIIKKPAAVLKYVPDVSEGLENRIKNAAKTAQTFDGLCHAVKTKRYTLSRIRRIILSAYLDFTLNDRERLPEYIKVLAHNDMGRRVIAESKKYASLPIVRNNSQINRLGLAARIENDPRAVRDREEMLDLVYKKFEK